MVIQVLVIRVLLHREASPDVPILSCHQDSDQLSTQGDPWRRNTEIEFVIFYYVASARAVRK